MAEKFTPLHYIVIVLVIGLVAAVAAVSWNTADPATISVSGSAEMLADPNEAHLYLGVTSQSVTASQAQQMASTTIGTVIVALKNAGVAEDGIETYYVRLTPRYDYSETGKRDIVGYDAIHMLKAKADVDSAGDAINAAVMAGGNKIEKIEYSVDKETEASLKKELLAEAAADARAKAEGLASALGVKIVRVKAASESVSFIPYRAMMEDAVLAGGPAPMPPGKVELTGTASVVYEII